MISTPQFICGTWASSSRTVLFLQRREHLLPPKYLLLSAVACKGKEEKSPASEGQSTSRFRRDGCKQKCLEV